MPKHKLGWTYNPIPQTKVVMKCKKVGSIMGKAIKTDVPVTYTRKEKWIAYLRHPDPEAAIRGAIMGALSHAAAVGLAAGGGIGVLTANPGAAWAAFKAAFLATLKAECSGIGVGLIVAFVNGCDLSVDSETEEWK
eukprot:CAMPEP_0202688964 /NCGR_PEP_ID=MMETSP1385-20130828/4345_1 /ASSEMBLY_ACC=CAM_ASM_000861 /TAXON_ID=933848 /ORGANISM="Elphidium margaritaceum" /LENGTH=135 /DNA_ID=CAMNT_0049344033 /DNA_START=59 /DNA_END=466 /DNA_ORIENTATION=-